MKKIVNLLLPVVVLSLSLLGYAQLSVPGPDNTPKVGQRAPDFELPKGLNPQAGTLGMKDFAGKKKVLLAFYVADFTAGWTREFTEFGVNQPKFDAMNIEVIGISRDTAPSQAKFRETVNAKTTFLSDTDAKVINAYGAFNPALRLANRYYFLIDESGNLIWKNVTGQLIPVEKLVEDLGAVVKK